MKQEEKTLSETTREMHHLLSQIEIYVRSAYKSEGLVTPMIIEALNNLQESIDSVDEDHLKLEFRIKGLDHKLDRLIQAIIPPKPNLSEAFKKIMGDPTECFDFEKARGELGVK